RERCAREGGNGSLRHGSAGLRAVWGRPFKAGVRLALGGGDLLGSGQKQLRNGTLERAESADGGGGFLQPGVFSQLGVGAEQCGADGNGPGGPNRTKGPPAGQSQRQCGGTAG